MWRRAVYLSFATGLRGVTPAQAIFPGFNIGTHMGGMLFQGEHEYVNQAGQINAQEGKAFGFLFGAQVGFAFEIMPKVIAGLALSASKMSAKRTAMLLNNGTTNEGQVSISQNNALGGGLIFGMLINPRVSGYLYLGGETSQYAFQYTNLTFQTTGGNSQTFNVSIASLVPGIGVGLLLAPKIYAALEYNYPIGKKITLRPNTQTINGAQRGYSFKPGEHRLYLRVGLRFGN